MGRRRPGLGGGARGREGVPVAGNRCPGRGGGARGGSEAGKWSARGGGVWGGGGVKAFECD